MQLNKVPVPAGDPNEKYNENFVWLDTPKQHFTKIGTLRYATNLPFMDLAITQSKAEFVLAEHHQKGL